MSQILLSLIQLLKTLCGQYGSNRIVRIVSWLEFVRNIAKFNTDRIICNVDTDWSNFIKWTIWIKPYFPWLKFFKNISSSKKELSMESYVESLKGQYGSNRILSWSEFAICAFDKYWSIFPKWTIQVKPFCSWFRFLKDFWNRKKAWTFNENLIESLKRKITVKRSVPDTIFQ